MTLNPGIDVHCHIQHPKFSEMKLSEDDLIRNIRDRISRIIVAGYALRSNLQALNLQASYPDIVSACIGHHPTASENPEGFCNLFSEKKGEIIGVGEIGLDYFHAKLPQVSERQRLILKDILELVADSNLPLVFHSRDAEKDLLSLLENVKNPVILHSFNGAAAQLQKALSRKHWISVSTQVIYSPRVKEIVSEVPIENILLETDSPFLNHGEINYPWNILKSAAAVAEIKGMTPEKVLNCTHSNAEKVFKFKKN